MSLNLGAWLLFSSSRCQNSTLKKSVRVFTQPGPKAADPVVPYVSAYWVGPAVHTCAGEVIGASESGPKQTFADPLML